MMVKRRNALFEIIMYTFLLFISTFWNIGNKIETSFLWLVIIANIIVIVIKLRRYLNTRKDTSYR